MAKHGAKLLLVVFMAAMPIAAHAASSEADFKAALAAAEASNKEAKTARNQWTTTSQAIAAAKKSAAAGDYDAAVSSTKHAEELAKASFAQAKEQQDAWRGAKIH
jgi:hypothetical protein